VNRNSLHAAATGLVALGLPLAFTLASPAGASAAPQIGLKSCALPNTFTRIYYYSGFNEYCFGDAGAMNLNIPQVNEVCPGNNTGYILIDNPGGSPTTYYFYAGDPCNSWSSEVHVSYIDIY
jgi:hypothetical protein